MERLRAKSAFQVATIVIGLWVVLYFEWHSDEPSILLPVLLIVSLASGWMAPQKFVLVGICLGLSIGLAHGLSAATGLITPQYQKHSPSLANCLSMAALVIPALLATFAGSRAAKFG